MPLSPVIVCVFGQGEGFHWLQYNIVGQTLWVCPATCGPVGLGFRTHAKVEREYGNWSGGHSCTRDRDHKPKYKHVSYQCNCHILNALFTPCMTKVMLFFFTFKRKTLNDGCTQLCAYSCAVSLNMNKYDHRPGTPETEVVSNSQHGFLSSLLNFFEDDMSPFLKDLLKGTVAPVWDGLRVVWINRHSSGEVPLVVYYFFSCSVDL